MAKLRVTLVHSGIGKDRKQKRTIHALGFRRLQQTRELPDNPAVRGMVHRVRHLVQCENVEEAENETQ